MQQWWQHWCINSARTYVTFTSSKAHHFITRMNIQFTLSARSPSLSSAVFNPLILYVLCSRRKFHINSVSRIEASWCASTVSNLTPVVFSYLSNHNTSFLIFFSYFVGCYRWNWYYLAPPPDFNMFFFHLLFYPAGNGILLTIEGRNDPNHQRKFGDAPKIRSITSCPWSESGSDDYNFHTPWDFQH